MNTQTLHPYKPRTDRAIQEGSQPRLSIGCIRYDEERKSWWIMSKTKQGWGSYGFPYPSLRMLLADHKFRVHGCRKDEHGVYWTMLEQELPTPIPALYVGGREGDLKAGMRGTAVGFKGFGDRRSSDYRYWMFYPDWVPSQHLYCGLCPGIPIEVQGVSGVKVKEEELEWGSFVLP